MTLIEELYVKIYYDLLNNFTLRKFIKVFILDVI